MASYGIDFGTTNTAVVECLFLNNKMSATPLGEMNQPFPSLIALHPEKPSLFGMEVKKRRRQLKSEGYEVISSFKSILGNKDWRIAVGGKDYAAEDVTALFLGYVKKAVESKSNIPMTEAVISIPVDFQPEQRAALRRAASKAGIRARSFVSEPTAAYIYCQKEIAGASNVAVFDWGGGTLDVSILTAENGVIQELAVFGRRLGGNDIDETLARHFHARIMRTGIPKAFEDMTGTERDQIINQSEEAKKRLSTEDFAPILLVKYGGRKIARESVSLEEFQALIAQKVEDASDVLQQAARKAHITIEQLDSILMVGGSCEMRPIVRRLEQIGGSRVYRPENAQWVVAGGAAFLAERRPVYKLQQDFGVLMSDSSLYPVFKAGQEIPCQSPEFSFGVVEDTTNAVFIFADGQKNELKRVLLPIKGFQYEGLRLKASIDEDMIAHVSVYQSYNEKKGRSAEINQLSFAYCIE